VAKAKNIDKGLLLKEIVKESGIPIVKLVKKLGYKDRASYYAHTKQPDLPLDTLLAYAKVLNYDLRNKLPEAALFIQEPDAEYNAKPKTLPEAIELLNKWKEKYLVLLEKYNKLMEKDKEG